MVMDVLCCETAAPRKGTSSECSSQDDEDEILECDYDTEVTRLYQSVEAQEWESVLYFLQTGTWYQDSVVWKTLCGAKTTLKDTPAIQARTWVTALERTTVKHTQPTVRWCQLPLHAAITFGAPLSIISKLIETYPKSVRCADDQDMLPLHYAFRFGSHDDVLLLLLQKFPQAVSKHAVQKRLPLDLAQFGPRPQLGPILQTYQKAIIQQARKQWENEHDQLLHGNQTAKLTSIKGKEKLDLEARLQSQTNTLVSTLEELQQTKQQVECLEKELRQAQKHMFQSKKSKVKKFSTNQENLEARDDAEMSLESSVDVSHSYAPAEDYYGDEVKTRLEDQNRDELEYGENTVVSARGETAEIERNHPEKLNIAAANAKPMPRIRSLSSRRGSAKDDGSFSRRSRSSSRIGHARIGRTRSRSRGGGDSHSTSSKHHTGTAPRPRSNSRGPRREEVPARKAIRALFGGKVQK